MSGPASWQVKGCQCLHLPPLFLIQRRHIDRPKQPKKQLWNVISHLSSQYSSRVLTSTALKLLSRSSKYSLMETWAMSFGRALISHDPALLLSSVFSPMVPKESTEINWECQCQWSEHCWWETIVALGEDYATTYRPHRTGRSTDGKYFDHFFHAKWINRLRFLMDCHICFCCTMYSVHKVSQIGSVIQLKVSVQCSGWFGGKINPLKSVAPAIHHLSNLCRALFSVLLYVVLLYWIFILGSSGLCLVTKLWFDEFSKWGQSFEQDFMTSSRHLRLTSHCVEISTNAELLGVLKRYKEKLW